MPGLPPPSFPGPGALLCGYHTWLKLWWSASVVGPSCTPPVAYGYFCDQSCTVSHTPHCRIPIWKGFLSHPLLAVMCGSWDRREHRQAESNLFLCPPPYHVPRVLLALVPFLWNPSLGSFVVYTHLLWQPHFPPPCLTSPSTFTSISIWKREGFFFPFKKKKSPKLETLPTVTIAMHQSCRNNCTA